MDRSRGRGLRPARGSAGGKAVGEPDEDKKGYIFLIQCIDRMLLILYTDKAPLGGAVVGI